MKLSIITPTYNQAKFIAKTFQSLLKQNLPKNTLQYILVDGLSTDGTKDIVKTYQSKFKQAGIRFKYLREADGGQADAINKGWLLAKGEVISYINSDDYYQLNALTRVISFFDDNPEVSWTYGGWRIVNQVGKHYKTFQPRNYSRTKLLNYCNIGQPSCFFRRSLLKKTGLLKTSLHLAMDYDLWLRFAVQTPAAVIPHVLSNIRFHSQAKSTRYTLDHAREAYILSQQYTKPWSYRRLAQLFYYHRVWLLTKFGIDFASRTSPSHWLHYFKL